MGKNPSSVAPIVIPDIEIEGDDSIIVPELPQMEGELILTEHSGNVEGQTPTGIQADEDDQEQIIIDPDPPTAPVQLEDQGGLNRFGRDREIPRPKSGIVARQSKAPTGLRPETSIPTQPGIQKPAPSAPAPAPFSARSATPQRPATQTRLTPITNNRGLRPQPAPTPAQQPLPQRPVQKPQQPQQAPNQPFFNQINSSRLSGSFSGAREPQAQQKEVHSQITAPVPIQVQQQHSLIQQSAPQPAQQPLTQTQAQAQGQTQTHITVQTRTLEHVTGPIPTPAPGHNTGPVSIQAQNAASAQVAQQANQSQMMQVQAPINPLRIIDLGILNALMKDPSVTEIMVNDLRNVMIEREGKLSFAGITFTSLDLLNRMVKNILDATGRTLTHDQPYLDTVLPDGSRINIVVPPLTLYGPCITIRKFPTRQFTMEHLLAQNMMDKKMSHFLTACVMGRMNIVVCGGTGSGKTTLLNAMLLHVPKTERVIMIEDLPELAANHYNSVKLQTKPAGVNTPAVTARDLVANSLRMRPDRIIVGECRKAEAFDMLQAMNTGHTGSMTTLHANSARDCISRFETLALIAGTDLPLLAIRKQIASAVDLLVQVKRFRNGKRRVTQISEVTGMEGDIVTLQDIFHFELDSKNANPGGESGQFKCAGFVPTFIDRLREQGVDLPVNYFA